MQKINIYKIIELLVFLVLVLPANAGRYGGTIDFEVSSLYGLDERETSAIRAFEEDAFGYMWMSGWNGLFRYDGNTLKKYLYDVSNPNGISDSDVTVIRKGKHGELWAGSIVGLNRLNPETDEIQRFYHKPDDDNSLSNDAIVSLLVDLDGSIWIGTWGGGLNHYDHKSGKFTRVKIGKHSPQAINGAFITGLSHGKNNTIWVLTRDNGLFLFDREARTFTSIPYQSKASQSWWSDRNIVQDSNGYIWFVTRNALHRVNQDNHTISSWEAPPLLNKLKSLQIDEQGIIWLSAARGQRSLATFDTQTEAFSLYNIDIPSQSIYRSSNNKLWLASTNADVKILSKTPEAFSNITPSPSSLESFLHNEISPFFIDEEDKLWVIAQDRVFSSGPKGDQLLLRQRLSLDNMASDSTELDLQDSIWLSSRDIIPGLVQYERKTNQFFTFKHDPEDDTSISSDRVLDILTKENKVWVATDLGLNMFDPETGKFKRFYVDPQNPKNEGLNNLNVMIKSQQDDFLWLGSWYNGLFKFDLKTKTFSAFDNTVLNVGNTVTSLNMDDAGTLWITSNNGFFAYNEDRKIYKSYSAKDGIDTTIICSIRDDQGRQWIGSRSYLYVLNTATDDILRLDSNDGLNGDVFFENMCAKDSKGHLYFMSNKAVNIIDPDKWNGETQKKKLVRLTDLRLNNLSVMPSSAPKAILNKDIRATQTISLNQKSNSLSIHFSALEYHSPKKISYQYRLLPVQENWISTSFDLPFATFTSLPQGTYSFEARARHGRSAWQDNARELQIKILPAWYQTWWAITLFVFFAASILSIPLFFLRQRRAERKRTRQAIERSENLMRKLLNSIPGETFMLDNNGICTYANKACAEFLGLEQDQVTGLDLATLLDERNFDMLPVHKERGFLSCLESKKTVKPSRYHYFLNGQNQPIPVQYISAPTYATGSTSQVSGVVVAFFNATDQIDAENTLLRAEKMETVSTLLDGIVHDFNNTLQVINFTVDGIIAFRDDYHPIEEELNVISKAADGAMQLCSRLMAISNNDMTISLRYMDINQELPAMIEFIEKAAGQSISITTITMGKTIWIRADENLLQNALLNLALNAKDALKSKPSNERNITFLLTTTEVKGIDFAVIKVIDNGVGIPQEDILKIREPFYSTKTASKGSGLGITMVDRFMINIGGEMQIQSTYGEGTFVSLYFPITMPDSSPETKPLLSDKQVLKGNGESILVIEDNQVHLDILQNYLVKLNYKPICASSSDEAFSLYEHHSSIDMILSDIMLKGSASGPEIIEQILQSNPEQKYCFMTGYIAIKEGKIALHEFDSLLVKPFSIYELANTLNHL